MSGSLDWIRNLQSTSPQLEQMTRQGIFRPKKERTRHLGADEKLLRPDLGPTTIEQKFIPASVSLPLSSGISHFPPKVGKYGIKYESTFWELQKYFLLSPPTTHQKLNAYLLSSELKRSLLWNEKFYLSPRLWIQSTVIRLLLGGKSKPTFIEAFSLGDSVTAGWFDFKACPELIKLSTCKSSSRVDN